MDKKEEHYQSSEQKPSISKAEEKRGAVCYCIWLARDTRDTGTLELKICLDSAAVVNIWHYRSCFLIYKENNLNFCHSIFYNQAHESKIMYLKINLLQCPGKVHTQYSGIKQ